MDGSSELLSSSELTERIAALEAALRDSERWHRMTQRAGGFATFDWDVVANRAKCSVEYFKLFGLEPTDDPVTKEQWLSRVHADDRAAAEGDVGTAIEEGGRYASDYRIVRPDGQIRWLTTSGQAFFGDHGQPTRMIGALRDATAEKALRAAERLASVGTLAAGVAHEINNPLSALVASSQAALNVLGRQGAEDTLRQCLENILAGATRCSEIVNKLRRFAGRQPTAKCLADLNTIVRAAVEATQEYTAERKATIELSLAGDLPPIAINALEIELLVLNLVRNAADCGDGGLTVTVGTKRMGRNVRLSVRDNGPGITEESRQRAFEPFYSTRYEHGGMGLGLSIVHGIVVDHDGSVAIEPAAGGGTTVIVDLPVPGMQAS